jgi:hypothetical protein
LVLSRKLLKSNRATRSGLDCVELRRIASNR